MSENNNIVRSHCNHCTRETKHLVLKLVTKKDSEEVENVGTIYWEDTYELLECCGCENISMRHSHWFEPAEELKISIYPSPVTRHRPHWIYQIPFQIHKLLFQVYKALDSDSRALALMGARAVLDMVLTETVGDKGSFSSKLDALEKAGFIGSQNRKFLDAALDAGNAASHRGYQPSPEDLNAVMDIVENLLQAVYHLNSLVNSLKKSTPKRNKIK